MPMPKYLVRPKWTFVNLGNNCWFNSLFQIFLGIPELACHFRANIKLIRENIKEDGDYVYGDINNAKEFVQVYINLMKKVDCAKMPGEGFMVCGWKELGVLFRTMREMIEGTGIVIGIQQDASEALDLLLNKAFFRLTFIKVPEEPEDWIRTMFTGCYSRTQMELFFLKMCVNRICNKCYFYSYEYHVMNQLQLTVPQGKMVKVADLMDEFSRPEILADVSKC